MTVIIILAVICGILVGLFLFPSELLPYTDHFISVGLCMLLLLVGIDIGKQKNVLNEIKKLGVSILIIPVMVAVGSIVGGLVAGSLLGMPLNESGALGAGFGWYSLSAIILADYSAELSALAFLSNVFREVLAIMIIPFVAKWIGYMEAVAPPGATAMDTTLPIVTKYTDSKIAVLSFISGCVLSMLVPIVVPVIIALG